MEATNIERVLVAVDGSIESQSAVSALLGLNLPLKEALVLTVDELAPERDSHTEAAADTARQLTAAGLACTVSTPSMPTDAVGAAIVHGAQEFRPDLVVMGSHGHGDFVSLVHGSASHRVLSAVGCPVLLGRGTPSVPGSGRILLALGGHESDATAIAAASGLARCGDKKLIVVHVVRTLSDVTTSPFLDPRQAEVEMLNPVLDHLRDGGLAVEGVVAAGGAAEEIAKLARAYDVDVIVIGHGARSDLGGLLAGDVRTRVIHLSDRPVLVSPAHARRPASVPA